MQVAIYNVIFVRVQFEILCYYYFWICMSYHVYKDLLKSDTAACWWLLGENQNKNDTWLEYMA